MEKIEDLESYYNKENERLDKNFIDKIKGLKNITEAKSIEKDYKNQLKGLRDQYQARFKALINNQKELSIKDSINKSKKKIKNNRTIPLEIKKIDLKDNWKNRLGIRWELFKFNLKFRKDSFIKKLTPNYWIMLKVKIRILRKRFFNGFREIIIGFFNSLKKIIINIGVGIKNIFLFVFRKIKNTLAFISKKIFTRNKKVSEKTEKRPDEEIADKILKKS